MAINQGLMGTKYGTGNNSLMDSLVMKGPTFQSIQLKGKAGECAGSLCSKVTPVLALSFHFSYQYLASKYLIILKDASPVTFAFL